MCNDGGDRFVQALKDAEAAGAEWPPAAFRGCQGLTVQQRVALVSKMTETMTRMTPTTMCEYVAAQRRMRWLRWHVYECDRVHPSRRMSTLYFSPFPGNDETVTLLAMHPLMQPPLPQSSPRPPLPPQGLDASHPASAHAHVHLSPGPAPRRGAPLGAPPLPPTPFAPMPAQGAPPETRTPNPDTDDTTA